MVAQALRSQNELAEVVVAKKQRGDQPAERALALTMEPSLDFDNADTTLLDLPCPTWFETVHCKKGNATAFRTLVLYVWKSWEGVVAAEQTQEEACFPLQER
jgi:hypothetical protein